MNKLIFTAVLALCFSSIAFAQPRPLSSSGSATAKPAPESFPAKYDGGMLGFNDKEAGTLKFDNANERLVFFGKAGKESFSIPYDAILVVYPQSQSVTSTTGNVVSHIPLPGAGLAGFIKEKRRYLIVQFDDPDVDVKGAANFRLDDRELLDSVLQTLAERAKLTQRGDAYYRPKSIKPGT
ncbi:MAG: hypothetical protein ABJA02_13715 [Acidobacteriota bacterium]